ncbi:MAG: esterase family protein [Anaerolineales bacterium]|nr:esterase family protein [Anaerolineales bacterium]
MNREYHRWHSPALNREMELLVFGHAGAKVLVFPTSLGKYYEWEDRGMIGALGEHLERGWIQLFCVDSIDAESWYARWAHPGGRAWRHVQYENYLVDEVVPLMRLKNANPFTMTTGASFGAYHAANFAFRHPELVRRMIGMSGVYDIRDWTDGYHDDNIYFNNPVEYLPNEHENWRLEQLRSMDIILVTGRDDPNRAGTEHLSSILWNKGIGNALRLWDGWAHDWPWWRDMIRLYIRGHD